jgi:hypothetical protein
LGIFIINFQAQPTQTIYIKAQLSGCSSVLMAEAASLALVASITQALNINSCNYLSDCQQLVHFMNNKDSTNPPNWRIQPFTKVFTNTTRLQATRIFRLVDLRTQLLMCLNVRHHIRHLTHSLLVCALDYFVLQALHLLGLAHVTAYSQQFALNLYKIVCCKKKALTKMVVAASATVVKDCVVGSPWLYCLG